MASYDFFSQPRGPEIDISLFGNAALQGAKLGQATPSAFSSIVNGLTQGVETGLDLYSKYQQTQKNQADIENEQAIAKINQMKAEAQAAAQQNDILIAQQKSENELQVAKTTNTDLKNQDLIAQDLSSGDPNVRASVLTNPNYTGTLMRNKDVAGDTLSRIANDLSIDPASRQKALGLLDYFKKQELRLREESIAVAAKKASASEFGNVTKDVAKDAAFQSMLRATGSTLQPNDISKLDIISKNFIDIDPTTKKPFINYNKDVSGFAEDKGYVAVKDGKILDNVYIPSKTTADNLSLLKASYGAQGFNMNAPPTPAPTPAATPEPSKPYLERFKSFVGLGGEDRNTPLPPAALPGQNTPQPTPNPMVTPTPSVNGDMSNSVVASRGRELEQRALSNPTLRDELVAKGVLKPTQQAPQVTGTPTPSSIAPNAATTPNPVAIPPTEVAPRNEVTKKDLFKKVDYVISVLPSDMRKSVSPQVVGKVLDDPLLRDLDPIHKAIAAIESSGNRGAKGKGSTATGLFQLTDAAEKDMKVNADIPEQNVDGGVRFFNRMLNKFQGQEVPALFAYNLGPGPANDAFRLAASADYGDMVNALKYMKTKGQWPKILGRKDFEANLKYPLKVLAYKEAFEGITNA